MAVPDGAAQLAALPVGVLLVGPGHRIESVNPAAESLLGQSARRLRGVAIAEALGFEDRRMGQSLNDPDALVSARSMMLRTGGGRERMVDISLAPVPGSPGWRMVTIAETGAGPELIEQSFARGSEVSMRAPEILAHEIKNPLAGIKGAAQLLERKADKAARSLTGLIVREVDRIAALIEQMQTLSQRTAMDLQPLNVFEALSRARAVVMAGRAERIEIVEDYDPSIPLIMGSEDALERMVINLLVNALDACAGMDAPRVTLATRFASGIRLRLPGEDRLVRLPVEIRVSDNGPGVPDSVREHLFTPFVTSKAHGQGLGLALVQKLATGMHGRVVHERDPARGLTHFRVLLPVAERREDRAA